METFQDYAYYYNAFYKDKDYVTEAKQIDGLIKKYAEGVRSIIIMAVERGNMIGNWCL